MKVRDFPSAERFSASSDLEVKLVTILSVGMAIVPSRSPDVDRLSRKIGELMPKLESVPALFQTLCESFRFGYSPLSLATPQGTFTLVVPPGGVVFGTLTVTATQPGGNVSPITTVSAVPIYTLLLSTRLSEAKVDLSPACSAATSTRPIGPTVAAVKNNLLMCVIAPSLSGQNLTIKKAS